MVADSLVSPQYERLSQREQILQCPSMYLGNTGFEGEKMMIVRPEDPEAVMRVEKLQHVPALLKIFDEILVNAADEAIRKSSAKAADRVKTIFVHISEDTITVANDGTGISTSEHKSGILNPELIFGHLNTSSNYNRAADRITGGVNGFGAKGTNIFSDHFEVNVKYSQSSKSGVKAYYHQVWTSNMENMTVPAAKSLSTKAKCDNIDPDLMAEMSKKRGYCIISFRPDYSRFGEEDDPMDTLDDSHKALFVQRVHEIAGCLDAVSVWLKVDGSEAFDEPTKLPNGFHPFIKRITCLETAPDGEETLGRGKTAVSVQQVMDTDEDGKPDAQVMTFTLRGNKPESPAWDISIVKAGLLGLPSVSFINNINMYQGGAHVKAISAQIRKKLSTAKNAVKEDDIKTCFKVCVRATVVGPVFDAQKKHSLVSFQYNTDPEKAKTKGKQADGGETVRCDIPELPKGLIDKIIADFKIKDHLKSRSSTKQTRALKATDGKRTTRVIIPKLEDANWAGTSRSKQCTLIITEGDSAKSLAVAGLSVVGRDRYGVFPLRGKVLNVRNAKPEQEAKNAEIAAIKQILGLSENDSTAMHAKLRYGKLMLMTDQDVDGSHIKGLVLSLFDHKWATLCKAGFLQEFVTPIVKATKGGEVRTFYTLPEYESWTENEGAKGQWRVKYYKGLGSSSDREAVEYFKAIAHHTIDFTWAFPKDESRDRSYKSDFAASSAELKKVFNADRTSASSFADERKKWLATADMDVFVDHNAVAKTKLPIHTFVNKELVLYCQEDNFRSIPSVVDGLKPGSRKILFACFKRKLKEQIKVAQLAGYVSEHAAYHHGEASLSGTIIGMAQSFVGSNNIPLLMPEGQFGSREQGGKNAASPRYVHTRLSDMARLIFPEDDDPLLDYLVDDGQSIEPAFYVPVIPMVLINGAAGIGTGWATNIPNHSPLDVIDAVRRRLHVATREEAGLPGLAPWYVGWTGTIAAKDNVADGEPLTYEHTGRFDEVDPDDDGNVCLEISELPIGTWTEPYKELLEQFLQGVYIRRKSAKGAWQLDVPKREDKATTAAAAAKKKPAARGKAAKKDDKFDETVNDENNKAFKLADMTQHHGLNTVRFKLSVTKRMYDVVRQTIGWPKLLKMSGSISKTNMVVFDRHNRIVECKRTDEIIEQHYQVRSEMYQRRMDLLLLTLRRQFLTQTTKAAFINLVNAKELDTHRPEAELIQELWGRQLLPDTDSRTKILAAAGAGEVMLAVENDGPRTEFTQAFFRAANANKAAKKIAKLKASCYNSLLDMPIRTLTKERAQKLHKDAAATKAKIIELVGKTPKDLWLADLQALEDALMERDSCPGITDLTVVDPSPYTENRMPLGVLEKQYADVIVKKERKTSEEAEKRVKKETAEKETKAKAEDKPVKRKAAKATTRKVKSPAYDGSDDEETAEEWDSDMAMDESEEDFATPAPKPRAASKRTRRAPIPEPESDSDAGTPDSAAQFPSIKQRIAKATQELDSEEEAATPVQTRPRARRARAAAVSYYDDSDSEAYDTDDFDEDMTEPEPTPEPKAKRPARRTMVIDTDESEESTPAPKKAAKKKAAPKRGAKKQPVVEVSDTEEEEEKPKPTKRKAPAKPAPKAPARKTRGVNLNFGGSFGDSASDSGSSEFEF
ncbi:DNA topoisomerase 2 Alpha [Carpediemonas membranifera]|uniref:DNA topoisomerase (ATP-hydrolyzing) n=1 Tax=Carpediemonas membranifera TaxID=201153 RepID=A0A8J6EB88_9EUKA|nr:DNA topoisomerase 2 Alpha [Carpediemonas membranifera]|eukprot:KAG9396565.1 DNA topoisomerase 2 Alpha [Carpediemonas membranifera]